MKCFGREGIWLNFEIILEGQGMREELFAWPLRAVLPRCIGRKALSHPKFSAEDCKLFDLIVKSKGILAKSTFL
jgi:hypothetical protein